MSFDYIKATALTETALKSGVSVTDGMGQLLNFCATSFPNPAWESIRRIDFENDLAKLRVWLEKVLTEEPPTPEINAFWFGLFNPILPNKQPTCGLYISGSPRFSPEDESNEWAVLDDDSYLPKGRYAPSSALQQIYELVKANGVADIGEYVLCLGYTCLAVKAACRSISPKLLLGQGESRAIAAGFDSGDFIMIEGARTKST